MSKDFRKTVEIKLSQIDSLRNIANEGLVEEQIKIDSVKTLPVYKKAATDLPISSEIIPEVENIGEYSRNAIIQSLAKLDSASDRWTEEFAIYQSDSKQVAKLRKEEEALEQLRNMAYEQAYPRWYQSGNIGVTGILD